MKNFLEHVLGVVGFLFMFWCGYIVGTLDAKERWELSILQAMNSRPDSMGVYVDSVLVNRKRPFEELDACIRYGLPQYVDARIEGVSDSSAFFVIILTNKRFFPIEEMAMFQTDGTFTYSIN